MEKSVPIFKTKSHNLPPQAASFVGREREVAEVLQLLAKPDCRLLTVVGLGGSGKTRLAIQAAQNISRDAIDDIYFVPLQAVDSLERFIPLLADVLHLPLNAQLAPKQQVFNFLHDKALLLVFDNFEHLLLPGGALLLTELLTAAPKLKLLITSRELLNLQEEWLYPLQGLTYPTLGLEIASAIDSEIDAYDDYGAIQLFIARAQRMRPDFSLASERAGVVRICQLVEGLPLALELAASWVKTMPCALIAAEIERNLNFLTTSLRNIPEQHRSIQAVFDHSWSLLSQEEQQVFKRLSIFHGGFRREAAEQITGASLQILSSLVDKSLVRWEADGRYQVHEILRQYAALRLSAAPEESAMLNDLHCSYYAKFLGSRQEGVLAGRQREIVGEITADLDNVRSAWQWMVDHAKLPEMYQSIMTLDLFYQMSSRYLEAEDVFSAAARRLETADLGELGDKTLAEILTCLGWYCIRLGKFEEASNSFARSQAIFQRIGAHHRPGNATDPLVGLAMLANIQGNYTEAAQLAEAARQQNAANGDAFNQIAAYYVLGNVALAQGNYQRAHENTQQAYALAEAVNERWTIAYYLSDLGHVARALGQLDKAWQRYQAAYDLRQEFGDREGMAVALNHLGEIARLQQDYRTAEDMLRQSLAIYRTLGDQGGLAATLNGLGQTACAQGDYRSAQDYLQESFLIATQIQFVPLTLAILTSLGEWLLRTGRTEVGTAVLTIIQQQPTADQETKTRAQQVLTTYAADRDRTYADNAPQRGQAAKLADVIAEVQAELAIPFAAADQARKKVTSTTAPTPSPQALIEPLTERELEVLHLIAAGLTNREIAQRLILAVGTVKYYSAEIYGKLGVRNRVQAVERARELNLL